MARWAVDDGPRRRDCGFNHHLQHELDQSQQALGVAVQKAVVANPAKALGQDVLKDPPQEVLAGQRSVAGLAGCGLGVAEGHLAVAVGHEVTFADHAPVEVA